MVGMLIEFLRWLYNPDEEVATKKDIRELKELLEKIRKGGK